MVLIILLLILLFLLFNYEHFCATNYIELTASLEPPKIKTATSKKLKTTSSSVNVPNSSSAIVPKSSSAIVPNSSSAIVPNSSSENLPSNVIKKCCPNTGNFTLVIYGDTVEKSSCCQNYKKTILKKEKAQFRELPNKAGFCTTIL